MDGDLKAGKEGELPEAPARWAGRIVIKPINQERMSSMRSHHIFHMTPRFRVLLRAQRHLGTVEPIQVPVFNAMHALVRVDIDPELIARASP